MIADIWTVMWKEWKELYAQYRKGDLSLLVNILGIGFVSVITVLQAGEKWLSSPLVLIYSGWIPLLLVSSVIADAFAGERERHTLEPLLASRLSDTSILIGKIAAGVSYGWGYSLFMLLIGLVTVNLIDVAGNSYCTSCVTGCRLNEDLFKRGLPQYPAISYTVESNSSSQAEMF